MKSQLANIDELLGNIQTELKSCLTTSSLSSNTLKKLQSDIKENISEIIECGSCPTNEKSSSIVKQTITSLLEILDYQKEQNEQMYTTLEKEKEKTQELIKENNTLYLDALTGIGNRHKYDMIVTEKMNSFKTNKTKFTLAILDIDLFKNVNDKYGHEIGDKVLTIFANFISKNIEKNSEVFRYGGEEFVIISEQDQKTLFETIERLRFYLTTRIIKINAEISIKISFSGGIDIINNEDNTIKTLFCRADKMLYKAKSKGRNQILVS